MQALLERWMKLSDRLVCTREITNRTGMHHTLSIVEVIKLEEHTRWQGSGEISTFFLPGFPAKRIEHHAPKHM